MIRAGSLVVARLTRADIAVQLAVVKHAALDILCFAARTLGLTRFFRNGLVNPLATAHVTSCRFVACLRSAGHWVSAQLGERLTRRDRHTPRAVSKAVAHRLRGGGSLLCLCCMHTA